MPIITRPQCDDYDKGWEATFGKKKDESIKCVGYPKELPPRYNGGVLCDMWIGPCACGATHTKAEYPPESFLPREDAPRHDILKNTTHRYCDHQTTTSCANGCQAWMGGSRSGGPDPFGECPTREVVPTTPCRVCKRMPQENGRPSRPAP